MVLLCECTNRRTFGSSGLPCDRTRLRQRRSYSTACRRALTSRLSSALIVHRRRIEGRHGSMAEGRGRAILSTLADVASVVTAVGAGRLPGHDDRGHGAHDDRSTGTPGSGSRRPSGSATCSATVSQVRFGNEALVIMVRPESPRRHHRVHGLFSARIVAFTRATCTQRSRARFVDTGKWPTRTTLSRSRHPSFAVGASRAGECAREQGKFWDLRALLFDNQPRSRNTSSSRMRRPPVELRRSPQCMKEDRSARAVEDDRKEGQRLGHG